MKAIAASLMIAITLLTFVDAVNTSNINPNHDKKMRLFLQSGGTVDYYKTKPSCALVMRVDDGTCIAETEMTEFEMTQLSYNLNFVRFPVGCGYASDPRRRTALVPENHK